MGTDGTELLPNDRYLLTKQSFRQYYTSLSDEQSEFSGWIEDSDGQVTELDFSFNTDNSEEKEDDV